MDIGVTFAFALVVVAAVVVLVVLARRRRQEQRVEAAEHRHEAEIRSASARRREAEASEHAARARQDREVAEERHAAAERIDPDPAARTDDRRPGADRSDGGWHGPNANGGYPAVPSQRTGEHDRDRHEPEHEHSGPVRGLTDRLRRRG